jgi:alkenylglycerophosphocholine hydrolase
MQLTTRTIVLIVSVAVSLAYLFLGRSIPFPMNVVVKGLSVALLGIVALYARHSILAAALLLSSLGDVLLELGPRNFLPGLAAFLTAHIIYTVMFARHRAQANPASAQWLWPVLLTVYGVCIGAWLAPSLAQMRTPVFCYIAAIAAMAGTASRAQYRSRWVFPGALLFLISDSLLGINRFKMEIPWSGFLIWTTYYLGQCAIATGVLGEAVRQSAASQRNGVSRPAQL